MAFRSNGTMTYLGSDYSEDTPLIEISPQIRRLDGDVESLKVAHLGLRRDGWSRSYEVEGTTLRLQLGSEQTGAETLLFGHEYTVTGIFPLGDHSEYEFSGNTRVGKLRIPDEVGSGKICRIKVILIDEILEQELLAKKEAAKKERERVAEEEKLTVSFTEAPGELVVVLYHDAERVREAGMTEPDAKVIEMKGPNKLAGELVAYTTESGQRCWAYIKNLRKRSVTLPKDADIICSEEDLVDLTIVLHDEDMAGIVEQQAIAFYASSEGKLPLFGLRLRDKLADMPADAARELSVKIKPGTYYARMGEPMEKETAVGKVTVSAEGPNTWQLKLPD